MAPAHSMVRKQHLQEHCSRLGSQSKALVRPLVCKQRDEMVTRHEARGLTSRERQACTCVAAVRAQSGVVLPYTLRRHAGGRWAHARNVEAERATCIATKYENSDMGHLMTWKLISFAPHAAVLRYMTNPSPLQPFLTLPKPSWHAGVRGTGQLSARRGPHRSWPSAPTSAATSSVITSMRYASRPGGLSLRL